MATDKLPPLASQYVDGEPPNIERPSGGSDNKIATEVLVGIISAVASIAGATVSAASQSSANRTNVGLAEESYRQNLMQWQRENAYNSPLAQRQRLIAAGLNPSLMYQSGSAGMPAASSPDKESPRVESVMNGSNLTSSPADMGTAYMQMRLLQEQVKAQQLDNEITEETKPTVVGNLRKQGELLQKQIDTEEVNKILKSTENYNKRMDELRNESRFDWESDRFDLDIDEQMKRIESLDIDNNFKHAANEISLKIMKNNEKISKAQAEQAAMQIVVIDAMDEQFAQDQYLIDNYYPFYVEAHTNHSARGNSYKAEGTMSPAEWLQSLPHDFRSQLLSDEGNVSAEEYKQYIGNKHYPRVNKYSYERNKPKYQHLYYKRLNQSKIDGLVQGYYSGSTSSSSFGASAFGFGANVN